MLGNIKNDIQHPWTYLRNIKDSQETGHYQRLRGASISDHHRYDPMAGSIVLQLLQKTRVVLTCHQLKTGLESFVRCAARVVDLVAQRDVGKQLHASVDFLNGKDHRLHPAECAEVKPAMKQSRSCRSLHHRLGIGDKWHRLWLACLVHCLGVGVEVKDKVGSSTVSWREKSPPKTMLPSFSSTGRDIDRGTMLHCWLWCWWETVRGNITHRTRPKNFVFPQKSAGSSDLVQKTPISSLQTRSLKSCKKKKKHIPWT